ncbi:MAG: DUF4258 domain-containing protein [Nitrospirae bacterium]|nr:DUF4258 domain-containing protein [Nitrospirota bacterium]
MKEHFLVEISPHAREQMDERGANETEVLQAIQKGIDEPARKGRKMYRKNFQFNSLWRGKQYKVKQVAPVVTEEGNKLVVVTVYVFYF